MKPGPASGSGEKCRAIYDAWVKSNPPLSLNELGRQFNTTRNTVAGAIHRNRKPADGRVTYVTRGKKGATTSKMTWVDRTRPLGQ